MSAADTEDLVDVVVVDVVVVDVPVVVPAELGPVPDSTIKEGVTVGATKDAVVAIRKRKG